MFFSQLPRDWLQEKADAAPSSGDAEEQNPLIGLDVLCQSGRHTYGF